MPQQSTFSFNSSSQMMLHSDLQMWFFFTGASGRSLLLSGFFVPAFGASYKTRVALNYEALAPQADVVDANMPATSMKSISKARKTSYRYYIRLSQTPSKHTKTWQPRQNHQPRRLGLYRRSIIHRIEIIVGLAEQVL